MPLEFELLGFSSADYGIPTVQLAAEELTQRPDVVVDVLLNAEAQDKILELLRKIEGFGEELASSTVLETTIPVLETNLNTIVANATEDPSIDDAGEFFDFTQAAEVYFASDSNPTALGLADELLQVLHQRLNFSVDTGTLSRGPFALSGGFDPESREIVFGVEIDASGRIELPFDLAPSVEGIGLSMDVAPVTEVNFATGFEFGFPITDLSQAFVSFAGFDVAASIAESDLNAAVNLGVLEAGVSGGTAILNTGLHGQLQQGSGRLLLSEVQSSDLVFDPPVGVLDVDLPLTGSIAGVELSRDPQAKVRITDDELFDSELPVVTTAGLDVLNGFSDMNPGDVVLMLVRLGEALQDIVPAMNLESGIPFVDTTLEQVVDFSGTLTELARKLYRIPVLEPAEPVTRLDGRIEEPLVMFIQVDGGEQVLLRVNPTETDDNRSLHNLAADLNVQLAAAGIDDRVEATSDDARLLISGKAAGTALSLSLATAAISAKAAAPSDGKLSEDVAFQVAVNGADPIDVNLSAAEMSGNRSISDLIEDLNFALTRASAGEQKAVLRQLSFLLNESTGNLELRSSTDLVEHIEISGLAQLGFESNQETAPNAARSILGFAGGARELAEFRFNNLTDLERELNTLLGESVNLQFVDGPNGRAAELRLRLGADYERPVQLDLSGGLDLGIGDLEVTAAADARFSVGASVDLGIGVDLSALGAGFELTEATELRTLNDGDGVRYNVGLTAVASAPSEGMPGSNVIFEIDILRDEDIRPQTLTRTLSQSATDDNFELFDLAADLNAELQGTGVEVGVTRVGNSQRLTLSAVENVESDENDAANRIRQIAIRGAAALGFAIGDEGQSSERDDFEISLEDGTLFQVNLDGARTVGDVMSAIEAATGGAIEVAIDEARLVLSGAQKFSVNALMDPVTQVLSTAARELGIAGHSSEPEPGNSAVLEGLPLHGDSLLEHFYINTEVAGSCGGNVCLTGLIAADDVNLQAALGILDVGVIGGSAAMQLSSSIGFEDSDGRLTLSELIGSDGFGKLEITPFVLEGQAHLPVTSSVLTAIASANDEPAFDISIFADSAQPIPQITYETNADFDNLLAGFSSFSMESVISALRGFVDLIQSSDIEALNAEIPLVGKSVGDAIGLADDLLAAAQQLAAGPDLGQLRSLHAELEDVLGRTNLPAEQSAALQAANQELNKLASAAGEVGINFRSQLVSIASTLQASIADVPASVTGRSNLAAAVGKIESAISAVGSLDEILENAISTQLGVSDPNLVDVTVDFVDGDNTTAGVQTYLLLGIALQKDVTESLGLSLSIPEIGPLAIESRGDLDLAVGGSAAITLALDLSQSNFLSDPLLVIAPGVPGVPHSSLALTGQIDAPILIEAGVGGIGVALSGSAHLGASIVETVPNASGLLNYRLQQSPTNGDFVIVRVAGITLAGEAYSVQGRDLTFDPPVEGMVEIEYESPAVSGPATIGLEFDEGLVPTSRAQAGFNTIGAAPIKAIARAGLSALELSTSGIATASVDMEAFGATTTGALSLASSLSHPSPVIQADGATSLFDQTPDLSALSLSQIVSGLNQFVDGLEDGLTSDVLTQLPIIGEGFDLTGSFVGRLRDSVIAPIEEALNATSEASEEFRRSLEERLVAALGVERDAVQVALSDPSTTAFRDMEFSIDLQISGRDEIDVPFGLGLDALAFQVDTTGGVTLGIGYDFSLGFGVSASDGFFLKVNDNSAAPEFDLQVDAFLNPGTTLETQLFVLGFSATDNGNTGLQGKLFFDIEDPDNSDEQNRLTFAEISNARGGWSSLFDAGITTRANVDLHLVADINPSVPSIEADIVMDWPISFTKSGGFEGSLPVLTLSDVSLDLGEFFEDVLGPIVSEVNDNLEPVIDVLNFITEPIPGISDLSEAAGQGPVDFLTLASIQFPGPAAQARKATGVVKQIAEVIDMVDEASKTGSKINFGSITLGAGDGMDLSNPTQKLEFDSSKITNGVQDVRDAISRVGNADRRSKSTLNRFARTPDRNGEGGMGVQFPLFSEPSNIFKLMMGETVDLVQWDIPRIDLGFMYDQTFYPIPGIPLGVTIGIGVDFFADFQVGLDTRGLFNGQAPSLDAIRDITPGSFLDGFYFLDLRDGEDIDELGVGIEASIGATLEVPGIASAGVEGGVRADVYANWFDPNEDGKIYLDELEKIVDNLGAKCVFELHGEVSAFVRLYYSFLIFSGSVDIVDVTLFEFDHSCPPPPEPARVENGTLILHMGPESAEFQHGFSEDGAEAFRVTQVGSGVMEVQGTNGQANTKRYSGVHRIIARGGIGDDIIEIDDSVRVPITIYGGEGDDILMGGSGVNFIYGDAGDDVIIGGLAADELFGGAGQDSLEGRAGDDFLDGGQGDDELIGGDGNDTYRILSGFGADSVREFAGGGYDRIDASNLHSSVQLDLVSQSITTQDSANVFEIVNPRTLESFRGSSSMADVILGEDIRTTWTISHSNQGSIRDDNGQQYDFAGFENLQAGAQRDEFRFLAAGALTGEADGGLGYNILDYTGRSSGVEVHLEGSGAISATAAAFQIDEVRGSQYDDSVTASSERAVTVFGFAGNDTLIGSSFDDSLNGGSGNDIVFGLQGNDSLFGESGADELHGDEGEDLLDGGSGPDRLFGGSGNDHQFGGEGNDSLLGDLGDDELVGGLGDDELDGGAGNDVLWGGEALISHAKLQLGQQANFVVAPSLEELGLPILSIYSTLTPLAVETISVAGLAEDGQDSLFGSEGIDMLFGGGNADVLRGGSDSDYLDGGAGRDELFGENGNDIVRGGEDDDKLHGGLGIDLLYGELGDDDLRGDGGDVSGSQQGQILFGGKGQDNLYAFAPTGESDSANEVGDHLRGGAGNDNLFGNQRQDEIWGGAGNDFLHGDYLAGASYTVSTSADSTGATDELFGESGEDQLFGGGGDDLMWGGADSDQLDGQRGSDTQYGGSGIDLFYVPREGSFDPADRDRIDGHFGNESAGDVPDDNATDILVISGTDGDDEIVLSQTAGTANPMLHIAHSRVAADGILVEVLASDGTPLIEQYQVAGLAGDDKIGFATNQLPQGIDPDLAESLQVFDVSADPTREPLDVARLSARSNGFVGVIDGNSDNDFVFGSSARDRIDGGIGSDTLLGMEGDDRLWGDGGDGTSGDHDALFAGSGNDDLIGGQGTNDLYAWSFDPKSYDPFHNQQLPAADFGVFVDTAGTLHASSDDRSRPSENTGLNRILGGPNGDRLYGGTSVDFLYGNGGEDQLFRSDGSVFESLDGSLAGDAWKEYARETGQVWYVGGTGANDEISVDFVTEPGLLSDHHLITRLTENNGNFSFAAQVRLDFAAVDSEGGPIWDASDIVVDANRLTALKDEIAGREGELNDQQASELQQQLERAETNLVEGLLPPEGDFLAIIVDALGGNDVVNVGPTVQKSVWVDGGSGDDVITIQAGNAILPDQAELSRSGGSLRSRNDFAFTAFPLFELEQLGNKNQEFHHLTMDSPQDVDWYSFAIPSDAIGGIELASASPVDGLTLEVWQRTNSGLISLASASAGRLDLDGLPRASDLLLAVTNPNSVATIYDLRFDFGLDQSDSQDMRIRKDLVRRDIILGGEGDDILQGGGGEDWIFGGEGNDVLTGGLDRQASDLMFAGPGDDTFQIITDALPLLGNQPNTTFDPATATYIPTHSDQMIGGDGQDRVLFLGGDVDRRGFEVPDFAAIRYNTSLHRYEFTNLVWDIGTQEFQTDANGRFLQHYLYYQTRDVEATQIGLQAGPDVFHADQYSFPSVDATWGIDLGDAQQAAVISHLTVDGGLRNDQIAGGAGDDELRGGPGDDLLVGGLGNDSIEGGQGNDFLFGKNNVPDADKYESQVFLTPVELAAEARAVNQGVPTSAPPEAFVYSLAAPFTLAPEELRSGVTVTDSIAGDISSIAHGIQHSDATEAIEELPSVGDINGDGFEDFLLKTDHFSYIAFGPISLDQIETTNDFGDLVIDHFALGYPASGSGDINADGIDDLAFVRRDGAFSTISVYFGAGRESASEAVWNVRELANTLASKTVRFNAAQINPHGMQVSFVQSDGDQHADLLLSSSSTAGTTINTSAVGLVNSQRIFESQAGVVEDVLYIEHLGTILQDQGHGNFRVVNQLSDYNRLEGAAGPWLFLNGNAVYNVELDALYTNGPSDGTGAIANRDYILFNGFGDRPYYWNRFNGQSQLAGGSGTIGESIEFDGSHYLAFGPSGNQSLYRWNGGGLIEIESGTPSVINPSDFAVLNAELYFTAEGAQGGRELWKLDGNTPVLAGPTLEGAAGIDPKGTAAINGALYFRANIGTQGDELYRFVPTADGGEISLVADLNPDLGIGSRPRELSVVGDYLYFVADIPIDAAGTIETKLLRLEGEEVEGEEVVLASDASLQYEDTLLSVGDQLYHSFHNEFNQGVTNRIVFDRVGGYLLEGSAISSLTSVDLRADGTVESANLSRFEFSQRTSVSSEESLVDVAGDLNGDSLTDFTTTLGTITPIAVTGSTISGFAEYQPLGLSHFELEVDGGFSRFAVQAANPPSLVAQLQSTLALDSASPNIEVSQQADELFLTKRLNHRSGNRFELRQADRETAPIAINPYALHFDGSATVNIPSIPEVNNGDVTTIEAWVRLEENPNGEVRTVIANGTPDGTSASPDNLPRGFEIKASDVWELHIGRTGGAFQTLRGTSVVPGKWTHVAAMVYWRNGSSSSQSRAVLYVDGNPTASISSTNPYYFFSPSGQDVNIGGGSLSDASNWKGEIDEVRIWNVERDAEQIKENYLSRALLDPGLIASWIMVEGSGSIVSDRAFDYSDPSTRNDGVGLGVEWRERSLNVVASSYIARRQGIIYGEEQSSNRIFVFGDGGSPSEFVGVEPAGDVNQDGRSDLLVEKTSGWYLLYGGSSLTGLGGEDFAIQDNAIDATHFGDYNGDGLIDLTLGNSAQDTIQVHYSIAEQTTPLDLSDADVQFSVSELASKALVSGLGLDLDADGQDDLLAQAAIADPINGTTTRTTYWIGGDNQGEIPTEFDVLENLSVPGSGSFVADRGTGRAETFTDGDDFFEVDGERWFRFSTLGDGSSENSLRIVTDDRALAMQLFDAKGAPISRRAQAMDLRHVAAGTYYLRVTSDGTASFAIEFQAPRRAAVSPQTSRRDADVLRGGGGGDIIVADSGLDRVYGGQDSDGLFAAGPEIRDLQLHLNENAEQDFTSEFQVLLDEQVNFADGDLFAAVAQKLGIATTTSVDGSILLAQPIRNSQLNSITSIDLSGLKISNWADVGTLAHLKHLKAANMPGVVESEFLGELEYLETLDLTGSQANLHRTSFDWSQLDGLRQLSMSAQSPGVNLPSNLVVQSGSGLTFGLDVGDFVLVDRAGNVLDLCTACSSYEFNQVASGAYFVLDSVGQTVAPILVTNNAPVISGLPERIEISEGASFFAEDILSGVSVTDNGTAIPAHVTVTTPSGEVLDLTVGSLEFSNDALAIPHVVLDNADNVTFATWFRNTKHEKSILSASSASNANEFLIFIDEPTDDDSFANLLVSKGGAGGSVIFESIPELTDGNWHHLVVVREAEKDRIDLYIDGQLTGSESATLSALSIVPNGVLVGQEQDAGGSLDPSQAFEGKLDELAIWRRSLKQEQITRVYESGIHSFDLDLSAYYSLNGNDGLLARDRSPNGHDGAIQSIDGDQIRFSQDAARFARSYLVPDNGQYTIEVSAVDAEGLVVKANAWLDAMNAAPTAKFALHYDQITLGQSILADGAASDDPSPVDEEQLRYQWETQLVGSDEIQTLATSDRTEFTPREIGTHRLKLTVTDPQGASSTQEEEVKVVAQAQFRIAGSTEQESASDLRFFEADHGDQIVLDASESSPKPFDSVRTYKWTIAALPGEDGPAETIELETDNPSLSISADHVGRMGITLTIVDRIHGEEHTSAPSLEHRLRVFNVAPVIKLGDNLEVLEGSVLSVTPTIIDPGSNQTHSISWEPLPAGVRLLNDSAPYQFTFPADGLWILRASVTDSFGEESFRDRVAVEVTNAAPDQLSIDPVALSLEGETLTFRGRFMDPANRVGGHDGSYNSNGDPEFVVHWDFGDGVTQTDRVPAVELEEGAETYLSTVMHRYADDGTYVVSLTVTDSAQAQSTVSTTVTVANEAPQLQFWGMEQAVEEDQFFRVQGRFSDIDGLDSVSQLDKELVSATIDFGDGTIRSLGLSSATNGAVRTYDFETGHSYRQGGEYEVVITLADDDGGVREIARFLSVSEVNDPPQARLDRVETTQGIGDFTIDVLRNDSSAPDRPEVLSLVSTSSGIHGGTTSIDASTGNVTYTPPSDFVGTDRFSYTIEDEQGATATGDVIITILPSDPTRLELDLAHSGVSNVQVRFHGSVIEVRDLENNRLIDSRSLQPLQRVAIQTDSELDSQVEIVFDSPQVFDVADGIHLSFAEETSDTVLITGSILASLEQQAGSGDNRQFLLKHQDRAVSLSVSQEDQLISDYAIEELLPLSTGAATWQLNEQLFIESFEEIIVGDGDSSGQLIASAGIQLDRDALLRGQGLVSGRIVNRGLIQGPADNSVLHLSGPVSGDGGLQGNILIDGLFEPGN
ncbi:MAG: LamG-like jellyroll fold domain-containing protein, partial [Planctomycetota bacterium]